jgi:hypothetical protein
VFVKLGTGRKEGISGSIATLNRTIKNYKKLPAKSVGTFLCKPKIFRKRFRKAIINGVK